MPVGVDMGVAVGVSAGVVVPVSKQKPHSIACKRFVALDTLACFATNQQIW